MSSVASARGAGDRMRRIGVAVEQLDLALRPRHQRVVNLAAGEHRAAGNGAVGDALGGRHQVGRDAEILAANGVPSRPKPVMTSSKISRMPCLSHNWRSRCR